MILAGDIGGTNTRLALCERNGGGFRTTAEENYASAAFSRLEEIVEKFLGGKSNKIERACFGVAGLVTGEVVELANLPWTIDARAMKNLLAIEHISLINDLEANAYGLQELGEPDFVILNQGAVNSTGNGAIIAAGTGLGEAGLYFEEGASGKFRPFPSEGGHADFAPRSDFEIELLRFLFVKFGRVSVERVVSGQGLRNIYEFLRETKKAEEPVWLAQEIAAGDDAAAIISKYGIEGKAAICELTLETFVSLYGAEAGNLALKMLATGGVFLSGGIAPKILPKLREPTFLESFQAKGRMRGLMEKIPVRVVTNDKAALLGAAHFAFYES
ncbi:MAG TPA: glucokinase [Pyrinomonadaceae bacterium]|nr:glucokinase [Pyrinomonadaceae bacterium]